MHLNKVIAGILPHMPEQLVWLFAKKYIAGTTIGDAVEASRQLNREGIMVTVDLLGEFVTSMGQAEKNRKKYIEIIDVFQRSGIDGNYSLKPTMFGLLLDREGCFEKIRSIVEHAASYGNFVRIDMEDSQCVDLELELFEGIKTEFPENTGLVIQAYLKRTTRDLEALCALKEKTGGLNIRICKGIYNESIRIAYKRYRQINQHYLENLRFMFEKEIYAAIATHDRVVVEGALKMIEELGVPEEMFEFQMLYGVTPELGKMLLGKGHKMRVYIPFGKDWMPYSVRRLKENPKMVSYILKSVFVK